MASAAPNPPDPAQPTHIQCTPRTSTGAFSDARPPNTPATHAALHAPWRLQYLESMDEQDKSGAPTNSPKPGKPTPSGSFLHDYWLAPGADEQNHVIVRADAGLILLNAFPYASGHLLVALGEARPTLMDYAPAQRAALWRMVDCAADLITRTLEPQGINIGVNQGRAAGAGVPGHLHVHLVPRWGGDTNFITVVGQVRIIPASLETMAQRYRKTWDTL